MCFCLLRPRIPYCLLGVTSPPFPAHLESQCSRLIAALSCFASVDGAGAFLRPRDIGHVYEVLLGVRTSCEGGGTHGGEDEPGAAGAGAAASRGSSKQGQKEQTLACGGVGEGEGGGGLAV